MTPKKTILLVVTVSVLAAILSACGTTRQAITSPAEPTIREENQGVSLTLRYIDDETLKKDFGTGSNPFLTQYYRMTFRRILVFELTLKNQSGLPVEVEATRCTLEYGAKEVEATNRFQLGNYWESLDDDPRVVKRKKELIERWVLPNRARIPDGETQFGYLVFKGNLPREGEATVRVPVFREGGSISFDFRYTF
jgi:hypothetical protein